MAWYHQDNKRLPEPMLTQIDIAIWRVSGLKQNFQLGAEFWTWLYDLGCGSSYPEIWSLCWNRAQFCSTWLPWLKILLTSMAKQQCPSSRWRLRLSQIESNSVPKFWALKWDAVSVAVCRAERHLFKRKTTWSSGSWPSKVAKPIVHKQITCKVALWVYICLGGCVALRPCIDWSFWNILFANLVKSTL